MAETREGWKRRKRIAAYCLAECVAGRGVGVSSTPSCYEESSSYARLPAQSDIGGSGRAEGRDSNFGDFVVREFSFRAESTGGCWLYHSKGTVGVVGYGKGTLRVLYGLQQRTS